MGYRDSQRFRKVYGYYRPQPRPVDTGFAIDKNYVDEALQSLDWKQSVRAASTTSVSLNSPGLVDGVTLADEDRVLLKNQSIGSENGIYIYYSASDALVRTLDAAQDSLTSGAAVYVEEGSLNSGSVWILSTYDPIVVGTTDLTWVQFPNASSISIFTQTGSYAKTTFSVSFDGSYTSQKGNDVFFFVSGTIGDIANKKISVFGGDLLVSGGLKVGDDVNAESFFIRIPGSSLNSTPVGSITGSSQGIVLSSSQDIRFTVNSGSYNLATINDPSNYNYVFGTGSLVESILSAKYDGYSYYRKGFLFGSNVSISGTLDVSSIGTLRPGWDDERDVDLYLNGILLNDGSTVTGDYEFLDSHTVLFNTTSLGGFDGGDIITVVIKNADGAPYGMSYVPPPAVTMGGDVSGDSNSATVTRIRNRVVSTTGPKNGDIYIFNAYQNQWVPSGSIVTALFAGSGLNTSKTTGSISISIDDSILATLSGATFTGPVNFNEGLSGSLTSLTDGSPYLIAGSNIIIATQSNGAISISSTASAVDSFFQSSINDSIFTTGSVAIRGTNSLISSSYNAGSDVFFYVSGSTNVSGSSAKIALFGGDLVTSGSISVSNGGSIVGNLTAVNNVGILGDLNVMSDALIAGDITGSFGLKIASGSSFGGVARFESGLSGSLTKLRDGSSYLIAGSNIIISSASNGAVTISSTASGTGGDSFFQSLVTGSIFTTGSVAIRGANTLISSSYSVGSDVFFYVSGSTNVTGSTAKVALFGGDIVTSGSISVSNGGSVVGNLTAVNNVGILGDLNVMSDALIAGDITGSASLRIASGSTFNGPAKFNSGLSGSLTNLSDGSSYIRAGSNITVATSSNGSLTISSTAVSASYFNSTTQGSIFTTGSVSFSGNQAGIDAPSDIGNDVFFYVSGSIGSKNTSTQGTAVFGGDVRVSGSLTVGTGSVTITSNDIQFGDSATKIEKSGNNLKISLSGGNLLITSGAISSNSGLTGSLTRLSDGTPYLLAGNGISIATGSSGAITITNDGTVGDITGVTAGTGLTGGGLSGSVSLAINNSIVATVSGTTFTGATKHNAGLSGSLTSLTDGSSYLIAGSNIIISTGSTGAVTISSTASGTGDGDSAASYLVLSSTGSLSNERVFSVGTGLSGSDGGSNGNYTLGINDSVVATISGSTFSGVTKHNSGLSGSLTKLTDGTSYLIAGNNINVITASNGSITLSSKPSGGSSEIQYNLNGAFTASSNFSYDTYGLYLTGAFSQGGLTAATGLGSHAEGLSTTALGNYSHAGGRSTIASGTYQTVYGQFNSQNNNFSLFVIGNGASTAARSDVFRVNSGSVGNGRVEVTGSLAATSGLSGSLTKLVDGTSYLIAGSNLTISTGSNGAVTINSLSASYINNLNQNAAITGSLTVGSTIADTPSTENTLNIYPPVGAPSNEGGQLLLAAPGGLYTSASMLDTWQNTFRILKGTNTNGSSASYFNLDLSNGNITTVGSITPGSYNPGDIIQMRAFKPGDSGVYTTGTAATSNSNECFFSCSFTPRSTTSYLVVEMCAKYECTAGASGNDDYLSTLTINGPSGTEIGFSYQRFSTTGGGDRSGVLFPLTGRYTNTSTTTKSICANVRRATADDNIVFDNGNQASMTMVVTEIGR